jgi:hypothetical protein
MWYSRRGIVEYRSDRRHSYRIGYAESKDNLEWERKDEQAGLELSADGWDSEMLAYPYIVDYQDKRYLFYNGNGFGRSGFGFALLT